MAQFLSWVVEPRRLLGRIQLSQESDKKFQLLFLFQRDRSLIIRGTMLAWFFALTLFGCQVFFSPCVKYLATKLGPKRAPIVNGTDFYSLASAVITYVPLVAISNAIQLLLVVPLGRNW